jgi:nicotinate-nucleotide pyrophosphorylase (carboxylating)
VDRDFTQIVWDDRLRSDLRDLLELAMREDLGQEGDVTTAAMVPEGATGQADVVVRQEGVVAGLPAAEMALGMFDTRLEWLPNCEDGQSVASGEPIARIAGPARSMLTAERPVLNLLGKLSGIATLTKRYVEAVAGTQARIYDTRKTTPGWRRLEKYAVRCGGGRNHRTGLFDAVLIKDNHLAVGSGAAASSPAEAVVQARRLLADRASRPGSGRLIIEVEVDTLEQLEAVLPAGPDVVLLDNMSPGELAEAVRRRDAGNPQVELEASGGIDLAGVGPIATTGVDRISVGALTRAAAWLDVGLDWLHLGAGKP